MELSLCFIQLTTRNNVIWFLIGDFLRFSSWSGDLGWQAQVEALIVKPFGGSGAILLGKFVGPFYNPLWILCAGYRNRFWWLGFCGCCRLERVWKPVVARCIFSLIIVKSLQLRDRKQITKLHKYYLVWWLFSLACVLSLLFFFFFENFGLISYIFILNFHSPTFSIIFYHTRCWKN